MRDFLLRLLGAPRQLHIHIDPSMAAVVRPGDTLLIFPDTYGRRELERGDRMELVTAFAEQSLPGIEVRYLLDADRVVVVSRPKAEGKQR